MGVIFSLHDITTTTMSGLTRLVPAFDDLPNIDISYTIENSKHDITNIHSYIKYLLKIHPSINPVLPEVKNMIETSTFDETLSSTTCSLCYETLNSGESIVLCPSCGSTFHDICIFNWLDIYAICTVCKHDYNRDSGNDILTIMNATGVDDIIAMDSLDKYGSVGDAIMDIISKNN